ncbi:MAG: DNA (cytosine-5-)-methyltransferase [Bacteroides sp.]|nr:DNA (cytosine-5-)-methyltransferase [Eubacterium sp.]MCM1463628.1 DNA (cytosine-5-)-methyltransferase [Bacteroides sp.]
MEQAGGFECIGFCEIDKHAAAAYRAMYDTEKEVYYDDVTRIDTGEMPDFDLFVGGFPCQPYSVASSHPRGFADLRGALFFELARIIKDKRPSAFFLENVPRLISHDAFRTFQVILCTLSEMGYCLEWMVLNSAAFNLAQSRERVYIVGHRRPERAGKIFPVECGDREAPIEIIGGPQGSRVYSAEGAAITQCAGGSGGGAKTGIYFFDMNPDFDFTENARCLLARYDSGVGNHKGVNSGVFIEGDFPNAIRFVDKNGVLRVGIMRKLMPRESWRLQGFSDEQFDKVAALGMRDGQLYKMAGNAVSVPVIKAIGEKIRDVIFDGGGEINAESCDEPPALVGGSEQN